MVSWLCTLTGFYGALILFQLNLMDSKYLTVCPPWFWLLTLLTCTLLQYQISILVLTFWIVSCEELGVINFQSCLVWLYWCACHFWPNCVLLYRLYEKYTMGLSFCIFTGDSILNVVSFSTIHVHCILCLFHLFRERFYIHCKSGFFVGEDKMYIFFVCVFCLKF